MGEQLVVFYRKKLKREWKLAFWSAFCLGLLVHIYKFTNLLPNHDSLYNFYSSQNMVASGRWFLAAACALTSFFDLPWFIGLVSLLYMGLTAAMVAEVFRMKGTGLILLSSGLLVSFPAITATMSYEFTADGYMLAMALAALSVCLTRMEYMGRAHWKKQAAAGLCVCLACGIYQAYVSFAFILAVCYFMLELLENRRTDRELWRWIGTQVLIYGGGLAGYYGIWKLALAVQGVEASSYLGISELGIMAPGQLLATVKTIIAHFVRFFLEWNILEYGVTVYSVLNILFLLALAAGLFRAVCKSGCLKRRIHLLLVLLCVASLPFGCYLWMLTSTGVYYRTIMLQSVCVLYIFAAVLYDRWICRPGRDIPGNLMALLLAAIVFNNSLAANMCYAYMDKCYEKTYADAVELSTRVHLLDDGTVKYVAFVGSLDTWEQEDYFDAEKLRQLGGWKHMDKILLSQQFLSLYTDFDLSYYRITGEEHPVVEQIPGSPVPENWEFRFPGLDAEQTEALSQTEEVRQMAVWPAADSVRKIGDTIVVKFSQPEQETLEAAD